MRGGAAPAAGHHDRPPRAAVHARRAAGPREARRDARAERRDRCRSCAAIGRTGRRRCCWSARASGAVSLGAGAVPRAGRTDGLLERYGVTVDRAGPPDRPRRPAPGHASGLGRPAAAACRRSPGCCRRPPRAGGSGRRRRTSTSPTRRTSRSPAPSCGRSATRRAWRRPRRRGGARARGAPRRGGGRARPHAGRRRARGSALGGDHGVGLRLGGGIERTTIRQRLLDAATRGRRRGLAPARRLSRAPPDSVLSVCEHMFVMGYVELHSHSAFSFLDGASLPDELATAAARTRPRHARPHRPRLGLGLDGVRAGGPGTGPASASTGPRSPWSTTSPTRPRGISRCSCATPSGWANLCRLLTRAHAQTRVYAADAGARRGARVTRTSRIAEKPRVTLADVEAHAEGLVCLSGCASRGVRDEPTMRRLLRAFGRDALPGRAAAPVRTATTAR